jgi:hypothetical protein
MKEQKQSFMHLYRNKNEKKSSCIRANLLKPVRAMLVQQFKESKEGLRVGIYYLINLNLTHSCVPGMIVATLVVHRSCGIKNGQLEFIAIISYSAD